MRDGQVDGSRDGDLHAMEITLELEGGWNVEDDFIAGVKSKGRVRPHPDFEDGLRYMRVVQAVADSHARNEWVEVKRQDHSPKRPIRHSLGEGGWVEVKR